MTVGLAAFGVLGPAEQALIDGLGSGVLDRLGDGGLPEAGDESRRVRADLIRYLLLGGPDAPPLHEKGIRLSGAWIAGPLDLEGCRVPRDIGLLDCRFEATPVFTSAIIDTLAFDGSDLPGLTANRLDARGDLLFRAATIRGRVELRGARIGGDMVFDGARLENPGDRVVAGRTDFGARRRPRPGRDRARRHRAARRAHRRQSRPHRRDGGMPGQASAIEANSSQVDGDVSCSSRA